MTTDRSKDLNASPHVLGSTMIHCRGPAILLRLDPKEGETDAPLFMAAWDRAQSATRSAERYVLAFQPEIDNTVSLTIQAAWDDEKPHELADLTPHSDFPMFLIGPEDSLSIDDAGLLTAMRRQFTASHVHMHVGCTLQLPIEFVEVARMAIELARKVAAERQATAKAARTG